MTLSTENHAMRSNLLHPPLLCRSIVAGAKLNTLKVSLSNALGFFLYELCKDMFEVDGRVSPLRRRRANAAAAAIPTAA